MRGTHEHESRTVIMGGPNKSGHDGWGWAPAADRAHAFVLFVFFVALLSHPNASLIAVSSTSAIRSISASVEMSGGPSVMMSRTTPVPPG
jgi:hypothetical protein